MKTQIYSASIALIFSLSWIVSLADEQNVKPIDGYVPNKEVAIKIALAVWEPIYGREQIENEAPYTAVLLEKGIWQVTGSIPENKVLGVLLITGSPPDVWSGGAAFIEIEKETGKILRVSH